MSLSPCGIECNGCSYAESCSGGCHESGGKPFYIKEFGIEVCPMFDCAVNQKGYKTCGECSELPCKIFFDWKDPSMSDEEHVKSINDRVKILKESK